jgi:hypothetical protein
MQIFFSLLGKKARGNDPFAGFRGVKEWFQFQNST